MKRKHVLAIVVVVVIAAAIIRWRGSKPEALDSLLAIHAIDKETAVVLWRKRIGVVDAQGKVRWHQPLPGEPYSGPFDGLAVAGDVVAVRYGHRADHTTVDHSLAAYSLRDGKLLWDIVLAKYTPKDLGQYGWSEPDLDLYISSLVVGGKLVMFTDTGTGNQLDTIDPATGNVLFTQPSGNDSSYAPAIIGSRVFTHDVNQTTAYDTAGKPAAHLETSYEGCVIGDDYITLERKHDENVPPMLVAYKRGDPAQRRVIVETFQPAGARSASVRRCGRYRDRMVLLFMTRVDGNDAVFVVITDASGTVLHTIDLGWDILWDGPGMEPKRYPLVAPLSGELTRFVPYVQSTYSPDEVKRTTRLLMLDLEDGKIAWAAPDDESIIHMSAFRSGTRWLTYWPHGSHVLSSFDGTTGELTASTQLHVYNGVGEIRAYHAAGDRIWIYGGTRTPLSAPTVGVLDTKTLAGSVPGIKMTDVTPTTRAVLGR